MLADEFRKAKSASIIYEGKEVFLYDTIIIPTQTTILLCIHKVKSKWRQGICLCDMPFRSTKTRFTVAGQTAPAIKLWKDTCPENVNIDIFAPNGKINIYNVWGNGNRQSSSLIQGAGMLIDITENGRKRYYKCNDGHPEPVFTHLEFSIEII
jgi:hypothetical protein